MGDVKAPPPRRLAPEDIIGSDHLAVHTHLCLIPPKLAGLARLVERHAGTHPETGGGQGKGVDLDSRGLAWATLLLHAAGAGSAGGKSGGAGVARKVDDTGAGLQGGVGRRVGWVSGLGVKWGRSEAARLGHDAGRRADTHTHRGG